MGEAGDQLIERQLGGRTAADGADQQGCFAQVVQQWTLLFEQRGFATGHDQQGAAGGLGLAAQHRGLQAAAVLLLNLLVERADLGDAHGAHGNDAAALQVAEAGHHLLGDGPVPQHRDHAIPIRRCAVEGADRRGTGVHQRLATLGAAVPDPQLHPLVQQPLADGLTEQTCAEQGDAGHGVQRFAVSISALRATCGSAG